MESLIPRPTPMQSSFRYVAVALVLLALSTASCGPRPATPSPTSGGNAAASPPQGPDWFADKSPGSGLDFTYRNGEEANHYTILESLGGGVGLLDYDRDGLLDVLLTGGGWFGEDKTIHGYP